MQYTSLIIALTSSFVSARASNGYGTPAQSDSLPVVAVTTTTCNESAPVTTDSLPVIPPSPTESPLGYGSVTTSTMEPIITPPVTTTEDCKESKTTEVPAVTTDALPVPVTSDSLPIPEQTEPPIYSSANTISGLSGIFIAAAILL